MKAQRDAAVEALFYEKAAAFLAQHERDYSGTTFHVSDVLWPRKSYFKATVLTPLSRGEIGYYLAGRGHHAIIEAVMVADGGQQEQTVQATENGITIIGSPDVKLDGKPYEVKTSRRWQIPDEPDEHYLAQLCAYCALLGVQVGYLVGFYITPGRNPKLGKMSTEPEIVAWRIEFTPEETAHQRAWLFWAGRALRKALDTRNPSKLPLCEPFMCGVPGRGGTYRVICPFYEQCQPYTVDPARGPRKAGGP